jgi:hypothetical protein
MQNHRYWEGKSQPELEEILRIEVASRSLIDAGSRTYARVNEVGNKPGHSRSLVFANGLRLNCKKQGWSTI